MPNQPLYVVKRAGCNRMVLALW